MKKTVRIVIIISIFIFIANFSYAKYVTKIIGEGKTKIKVPILILEKSNMITGVINKINSSYSTDFSIKNYLESIGKVNEINFKYTIKLLPTTKQFPVKYSVINRDTNEEILLNEDLETEAIFIGTEKTIHKYKVIVTWSDIVSAEELEDKLDVNIKINALQV